MRYYSSVAAATTLVSGISSGTTTMQVAATTGFPVATPFTLVVDPGELTEEAVEVTDVSGTTLTVTRGIDGTSATSHSAGAGVRHMATARDFREPQEHLNETEAHGATGEVVGTTNTQTLTNKTLTSPVLNTPTLDDPVLAAGAAYHLSPGGSTEVAGVPPEATESHTAFPIGTTVYSATTALGYPNNGLLVNHRYSGRAQQVLTIATVATDIRVRHWNYTTSEWGTWYTLATTGTAQTLSSKTLSGAALSGTTSNSGTISGGTVNPSTLQQNSVPVATTTGTQTLTNKTINSPSINTPTVTNGSWTGGTLNPTTLQQAGVDVVTTTGTQTLTNKTLTSEQAGVYHGLNSVTFSSGTGTLTHGLGFAPAAFFAMAESSGAQIVLSLTAGTPLGVGGIALTCHVNGSLYSGTITDIYWIAVK